MDSLLSPPLLSMTIVWAYRCALTSVRGFQTKQGIHPESSYAAEVSIFSTKTYHAATENRYVNVYRIYIDIVQLQSKHWTMYMKGVLFYRLLVSMTVYVYTYIWSFVTSLCCKWKYTIPISHICCAIKCAIWIGNCIKIAFTCLWFERDTHVELFIESSNITNIL